MKKKFPLSPSLSLPLSQKELLQLEKTMIQAALSAGSILRKYFNKNDLLQVKEKKDAGLVTQADVESENAILKILKKNYPQFSILAEESAPHETLADSDQFIIDPLDGTTNFVHAFPMFCVSIGAKVDQKIVAGVIYHPILNDLYTATLNGGAYLNQKVKLRVSQTKRLRDSLLTTGFTTKKQQFLHKEMEAFERLSEIVRAIRRPGSAALDLAYVARGVFDGFWERRLSPWDIAAGSLLVTESGGKVTEFGETKNFRLNGGEIIASNGLLHAELKKAISPKSCPI